MCSSLADSAAVVQLSQVETSGTVMQINHFSQLQPPDTGIAQVNQPALKYICPNELPEWKEETERFLPFLFNLMGRVVMRDGVWSKILMGISHPHFTALHGPHRMDDMRYRAAP